MLVGGEVLLHFSCTFLLLLILIQYLLIFTLPVLIQHFIGNVLLAVLIAVFGLSCGGVGFGFFSLDVLEDFTCVSGDVVLDARGGVVDGLGNLLHSLDGSSSSCLLLIIRLLLYLQLTFL